MTLKKKGHKSFSDFLELSKKVHGDRYDYSLASLVYKNVTTKVPIVCDKHGIFFQKPSAHYNNKQGCERCMRESRRLTQEEFMERIKEVHGDRYDYSKTFYEKMTKKVTITCKNHGDFEILPQAFIKGTNCAKCEKKESRFYKSNNLIKLPEVQKLRDCSLYLMEFTRNGYEDLYKIGVSSGISKRRARLQSKSNYDVKILHEYKSNLLTSAILENYLHDIFKDKQYVSKPFEGHTECFYLDQEDVEFLDFLFKEIYEGNLLFSSHTTLGEIIGIKYYA